MEKINSSVRLGWRERIGFGAGDFAHNLVFHSTLTYLTYFYTDVAGISAASVGIIFLVTRIWDGINDPIMGFIADHTRSRWGKFRPYLLFGAIPMAAILVATFWSPDASVTVKNTYAAASYVLLGMIYTMVNIPYSSLTAVMTLDTQERTVLTSVRMLMSGLGMMSVIIATKPLVDLFPSEKIGYPSVMAIYAIAIVLVNWYTFASVRERVVEVKKSYPVSRSFRMIGNNTPLLLLGFAAFAGLSALTVRNASIMYYFEYYLGKKDMVPVFFMVTSIPAVLAYLIAPWLSQKYGKKTTFIAANSGTFISGTILFFCTSDMIAAIFVLSTFFNFFGALVGVMTWSMLPDTVEYNQWKTGMRADGVVYSVFSLSQKMAMAAGGGLMGLALAVVGYVPKATQSPEALSGISALFALVPALFGLVSVLLILFYPITTEFYQKILREIAARGEEAGAGK